MSYGSVENYNDSVKEGDNVTIWGKDGSGKLTGIMLTDTVLKILTPVSLKGKKVYIDILREIASVEVGR